MNTPVLFLIFSRPDTTNRVFEAIRLAKPPKLYIAADGPRSSREGESERCALARSIIKKVDWECELKTLFRDENLGCGRAVSGALDWFFNQEEEGIILEDDVLPHPDFFPYCEELLEKYRFDDQVRFISGRNHLYGKTVNNDSYYFSCINHVWGWASWRRSWKLYNYELNNISKVEFTKKMDFYNFSSLTKRYWRWIYFQMKNHMIDTWDYQYTITLLHHNSLCVIPNYNLIENIGFDEYATHTLNGGQNVKNYKSTKILPLIHPLKIELNAVGNRFDIEHGKLELPAINYYLMLLKYYLRLLIKRRNK